MSNGPRTGDRFVIDGYQVVAKIEYTEGDGQIVVMYNSSSHILVAEQRHDEMIDGNKWAVLVASFPYYMEEADYAIAYRYALRMATDLAVKR